MPKALQFEHTMRLFFGDKAYHIAGLAYNPKDRKQWLLKLIKKIVKMIDQLDTTLEHKQVMMRAIESLQEKIGASTTPTWEMVYNLFRFCGNLLGYVGVHNEPLVLYSLGYYQTEGQYFTKHMLDDKYPLKHDKEDAVTIRLKLVKQLKNEGLSTFKIGLVLNITEYAVKKLLKLSRDNDS